MFNSVTPYRYLLPTMYLSVADIANPDLLVCGRRTWISLDSARIYEEQCQPSIGSAWPDCRETVNRALIADDRRGQHNLHSGLPDYCDSSTVCMPFCLESIHSLLLLHHNYIHCIHFYWFTIVMSKHHIYIMFLYCPDIVIFMFLIDRAY